MSDKQKEFSYLFRVADAIGEAIMIVEIDENRYALETTDYPPILIEPPQETNQIPAGHYNFHDREDVWKEVPFEELEQTLKNIRLNRLDYDEPNSD